MLDQLARSQYVCMVVHWLVYLDVVISGSFLVCCGTMGVLLLSYIYLFTKYSLLFVFRIERGAPASSIRLVVLNSARGIQTRLVVFKFASWYLNPSSGI